MWPFRRRSKGRHALGAAVTSIPSAAPRPPVPLAVPAPTPLLEVVADVPVAHPASPVPQILVSQPPPAPRVELGFRDGSSAALAPGSEQAKALTEIASMLTQRE